MQQIGCIIGLLRAKNLLDFARLTCVVSPSAGRILPDRRTGVVDALVWSLDGFFTLHGVHCSDAVRERGADPRPGPAESTGGAVVSA